MSRKIMFTLADSTVANLERAFSPVEKELTSWKTCQKAFLEVQPLDCTPDEWKLCTKIRKEIGLKVYEYDQRVKAKKQAVKDLFPKEYAERLSKIVDHDSDEESEHLFKILQDWMESLGMKYDPRDLQLWLKAMGTILLASGTTCDIKDNKLVLKSARVTGSRLVGRFTNWMLYARKQYANEGTDLDPIFVRK